MPRIAIVVSEFNYDITYLMLQKALNHAKFLGLEVAYVYKVPGTYEVSFAVKQLLDREDVEGVVVIGAVIKGETKHDEVIASQTARKLLDLMIQYNKPIGFGIIGPSATRSQALERVEDYARRAVEAVAKLLNRSSIFSKMEYSGETIFIE
ncbi:MAG: 6,7-dimethyl-8-ribityllumazine synthase [Desulfurococcales archaeon ex4484_58]|nr:MAG: 6,7-dimethyl-8-ribityllumazine synthase [Desulfurococcales archaeon ex4484_58]